jgi:hypothetical protein
MTILNRRNAFIGWGVLTLGRWFARRKVAEVVEPPKRKGRLLVRIGAVAAVAAAAGGALAFWRRSRPDEGEEM